MSSPKITRMFGGLPCAAGAVPWADAKGALTRAASARTSERVVIGSPRDGGARARHRYLPRVHPGGHFTVPSGCMQSSRERNRAARLGRRMQGRRLVPRALDADDRGVTLVDEPLLIGPHRFRSRLFLGTGKYPSMESMVDALAVSGTQCVTVAVRRLSLGTPQGKTLLDYLPRDKY